MDKVWQFFVLVSRFLSWLFPQEIQPTSNSYLHYYSLPALHHCLPPGGVKRKPQETLSASQSLYLSNDVHKYQIIIPLRFSLSLHPELLPLPLAYFVMQSVVASSD